MKSDTRTKLLQATRAIIDEEGLEAVTLRAVGARSGLSRGAAYRHFDDKEGLLAAIATEDIEILLCGFRELSGSAMDPRQAVRASLLNLYSFGLGSSVHYQLMFSTPWNPERFPELHRNGKKLFDLALELISKFMESEGLPASRAFHRTSIMYAFIHGLIELHLAGHVEKVKGLDDAEKLIEEFLTLLTGP